MNENNISDKKYVVFKLEDEFYGIDINNVKAIEKIQDFTRVPNSKDYISGVINLRGEVIPIIDLRKRFELQEKEIDFNSRIIIVFLNELQVGMIVDSSSEVIQFSEDEIDVSPSIKDTAYEDFVKSIGKKEGRLVILLNTEKVLGVSEIEENN